MARADSASRLNRRNFLAGAALAGAAGTATTIMPPGAAASATTTAPIDQAPRPSALPPTAKMAAAEAGTPQEIKQEIKHEAGKPGSDFMVDVIKTLDIKYLPCNPASSFRALHESLIDYGANKSPEFLTCMHEESAVGMAHGYFKVAGKPLMTLVHGTVGLQHAAMGIYNAWCDRVPVIVVGGNDMDAAHRPPGVPTFHSAQDINALVVPPDDAAALADAIGRLAGDAEMRRRFGQVGRRIVETEFSATRVGQETVTLYDWLTGHKRS